MATTADFRNGMVIKLEGQLFSIVEFQHVKPGKGGAFVRTKLKNVKTKAVLDRTFRAGERIEEVRLERRQMQYLYNSGEIFYFMDTETYDQLPIPMEQVGEAREFLKEGETTSVLTYENRPVGIELPIFVNLKVAETAPGVKGDTVSGGTKPATLETGAVIQVPLFIKAGDTVKVDTRTASYIERTEE
ncbi:MAG: elongation factor P [Candidatus Latescibacterota bacterium]|nr:MAG: elongation factor P [Candidatus Latescibacterota bacterium]